MLKNRWFNWPKNSKRGFTLIEIIVTLAITAILAATTIPSMVGFVDEAKKKSMVNDARIVYTAAQVYSTNKFIEDESDEKIMQDINKTGTLDANHILHPYLKNDVSGTISNVVVRDGNVESFHFSNGHFETDWPTLEISTINSSSISSPASTVSVVPTSTPTPTPIPKTATFDTGQTVNIKMKVLAGNDSAIYSSKDENIQGFLRANSLSANVDTKDSKYILSTNDSPYPIYAWYENNNIYYYTEANDVRLNTDSSCLFYFYTSLSNISGLQNLNTSNVTDLNNVFWLCYSITDISPLETWDTSNVTNLAVTFGATALTNISPLANWNISNVTDLSYIFTSCTKLKDISALSNWNTSNVTNLRRAFDLCLRLKDISPLANWNTSNVTDLSETFRDSGITDATCLNSWNVSKVTTKDNTFYNTSANYNDKLPSWYQN